MYTPAIFKRFTLPLLLALPGFGLQAQQVQEFDAYRNGKQIGKVITTMTSQPTGKSNMVQVHMKSNFLIDIHVQVSCTNRLDNNGLLQYAMYKQDATGGFDSQTETTFKQQSYQVIKNREQYRHLTTNIRFTTNQLYFEEPINTKEVFSENYGAILPLKHTAKGQYRLVLPDGNHTTYSYQHGKLKKVEGTSKLGTIIFVAHQNASYAHQ